MQHFFLHFLLLTYLLTPSCLATDRTFTFQNSCPYDIYVGSNLPQGDWRMTPGASTSFGVSGTWNGRAWGQSGCTFDGNGNLIQCSTCSNGAACTLGEWQLGGWQNMDFYDISLVDGYTVPTSVFTNIANQGSTYNCGNITCVFNINSCPAELVIKNADGSFQTCQNVCGAVNNATQVAMHPILATNQAAINTCCGTRNTSICGPTTWPVSSTGVNYYQVFKSQCTTSYAYSLDDSTSTFTCSLNPNYVITFCPGGSGGTPAPTTQAPTTQAPTTKAPTTTTTTQAPTTKAPTTAAPTTAPPTAAPTLPPATTASCTRLKSSIANQRCWGLGGGAYAANAAACAAQCCSQSGCQTWSWTSAGNSCWTGSATQGCQSDTSNTWWSGGVSVPCSSVSTAVANQRCWGLGGGTYTATAAACSQLCCSNSATCQTWSWENQGKSCWTGTASQGCDTDTSNVWFSGGAVVLGSHVSSTSLSWYEHQGYWIVGVPVLAVVLILLLVVLFVRKRRERSYSAAYPHDVQPKEAEVAVVATQETADATPLAASSEPVPPTPQAQAEGWILQTNPDSGKQYYYNTNTGVSQWETPDVVATQA